MHGAGLVVGVAQERKELGTNAWECIAQSHGVWS